MGRYPKPLNLTPEQITAIEANLNNKRLSWRAFAIQHNFPYTQLMRWIARTYGAVGRPGADSRNDAILPPPEANESPEVASLDSLAEVLAAGDRAAAITTLTNIIAEASDHVKVAALKLYFDETRGAGTEIGPPPPTTTAEVVSRLVDIMRSAGLAMSRAAFEEAFNAKKDNPAPEIAPENSETPSEGNGLPTSGSDLG